MANLRTIEQRAQEAILRNTIENYKQERENWLQEPTIRKAILVYSFFRLENAALIATTILAAGCLPLFLLPALGGAAVAWLGALVPLVLGFLAEIAFLYSSFRNEKLHAKAVADMFKADFKPANIQNRQLKDKVDKALEYWTLIDDAIHKVPRGVLRDRLLSTTREVTHWLQAVYNLAERVDKFYLNKVIEQDLRSVPLAIKNYQQKLREEDSPEVRRQLERTIADKQRQMEILQSLQDNMEKATYQLDSTISSLGTIYSQLLLVGSKDEEGSRVNRLQEEISEQVNRLEDLTEAMDDVYRGAV